MIERKKLSPEARKETRASESLKITFFLFFVTFPIKLVCYGLGDRAHIFFSLVWRFGVFWFGVARIGKLCEVAVCWFAVRGLWGRGLLGSRSAVRAAGRARTYSRFAVRGREPRTLPA